MAARRKPEERQREIADAVLKIVAEQGLDRLTAAEIARAVGVTDAALFHHFRSMDDIVLAAIDRVGELLFEGLPPEGGDPLERLGDFFGQRILVMHRHPGAGRLVLSDILVQIAPPAGIAKVRSFRKRSVELIRSCLVEARRSGMLAAGIDVPEATVMVLGSLMALTQARELVATNGSVDALAGAVWRNLEQVFRRGHAGVARPPANVTTRPTPNRSRRSSRRSCT